MVDDVWSGGATRRKCTTSDSAASPIGFIHAGDLTRFIHPLTDEIIAKVKWESPEFTGASFFWDVDIDQAVWLITD